MVIAVQLPAAADPRTRGPLSFALGPRLLKHRIAMTVLLSLLAQACADVSCGPESRGVAYSRSLSSERLAELYAQIEYYHGSQTTPIHGWDVGIFADNPPPAELRDLEVVRIRPLDAQILVQGCFDEFTYLRFTGLQNDEPRSIRLVYPIYTGKPFETASEVLWSE